jgi:hypothetical protein
MSKAKRRALYAKKLRDELHKRWRREQQEFQQAKSRQVDFIQLGLTLGKA